MIEIVKNKEMYPVCNVCLSFNNVAVLRFKSNKGQYGTSVCLCEDCRNKLSELIKEVK